MHFFTARQPLVGQGLLIIEASRLHFDTPHSVVLPWASDQPDAKDFYLTTHNTHKTSISPLVLDPSQRAATGTVLHMHTLIKYIKSMRSCEIVAAFPHNNNDVHTDIWYCNIR